MSDRLYNYVLLRNGKLICTKHHTYEIKAVFREDRPDTDYAFITFDKKLSFQGTQVLDTSDNFLDFLRNGDSIQFRHIGGWFEIYSPYRGCLFIVSGHKEYKTKNKDGEEVVYLNPIYTKVHDEMLYLITSVKKNFKIQGCEGKQRTITYYKNVNDIWEQTI